MPGPTGSAPSTWWAPFSISVIADGFGRPFEGMQTWNVPVGGGAIFELRLAESGLFPFVTHAFADATKGAVGVFQAGGAQGTMSH